MWDPDGNRYEMMNGGGWMVGFAVLALVLLLIAVAVVCANLFLHMSRKPHPLGTPAEGSPEARLVLDGRLARGEVTPEEYRSVRALLDGS